MIPFGIIGIAIFSAIFLESDSLRTRTSTTARRDTDDSNTDSNFDSYADASEEIWGGGARVNPLFAADAGDVYPNPAPDRDDSEDSPSSQDADAAMVTVQGAVEMISNTLCNDLISCRTDASGSLYNECLREVTESSAFSEFLGLPGGSSLQGAANGQGRGATVDSNALEHCVQGLRALDCSDMNGVGESDAGLINPELLEESNDCARVFHPERAQCETSNSGVQISSQPLQGLVAALCGQMATCNPQLACGPCMTEVMDLPGMGSSLGLGRIGFHSIDFGLATGLYQVDPENLQNCLEEIRNLQCGEMSLAWDSEEPEDLSGVSSILPRGNDSCSRIFSAPRMHCDAPADNPAYRLAAGICSSVATCNPQLACDACMTGVLALTNLGDNFGLPSQHADWSFAQLARAADYNSVTAHPEALDQCLQSMEALNCDRIPAFLGSRSASYFNRIERWVPGGRRGPCRHVFSE